MIKKGNVVVPENYDRLEMIQLKRDFVTLKQRLERAEQPIAKLTEESDADSN